MCGADFVVVVFVEEVVCFVVFLRFAWLFLHSVYSVVDDFWVL